MALENIQPKTRLEKYLAKIAGEEVEPPVPRTRLEKYLAKMAGADLIVPEPKTRLEYWLNLIANESDESEPESDEK